MKIVVTGGTSLIGSALIEEAIAAGIEVLSINRRNSVNVRNLPVSPLHRSAECNISEYTDFEIDETDEKYDAFFHLAWDKTLVVSERDNVYSQCDNIRFTLDAVKLAARLNCSVFVGAGSQAEYGNISGKLSGNTPAFPKSGYGIAKLAAGNLSRLYAEQLGIRHNWARILSVYGEKSADSTLIKYCINSLLEEKTPSLTRCEQIWDFMYADDCAKALLAIARKGRNKKTYCLGSGVARPMKEYIEELRDAINPELSLRYGEKDYYPHQPMYLCADISELISDTGYKPETSFQTGIRNVINGIQKCCF